MVFALTNAAQAGVSLDVRTYVNTAGHDVYIVSASSDGPPITSLGVNVQGDGNLGQYHPAGFDTYLQDYNVFFGAIPIDYDTQAMFETSINGCLICTGIDTSNELDINFPGFTPFASRDIVQIVLTGGEAVAMIGIVSDGQEYTISPYAQGTISTLVPEPVSLSLYAMAAVTILRRRQACMSVC